MKKQKIAVVGSGISGIVSAFLLDKHYDVTLIEAKKNLGGHTYSMAVNDPNINNLHVDMGFIVFNLINYPLFTKFLAKLKVKFHDSDMSFGYYNQQKKFYYNSDFPFGTFAQKKHVVSKKFWKFLYQINQFNKQVLHDLANNKIATVSLGDYLNTLPFDTLLKNAYILPMGAAIWSCPTRDILTFPAQSFFNFWKNHNLLTIGKRPMWKTIIGGSHTYINAFKKQFSGKILTNSPAMKITKNTTNVTITLKNNTTIIADYAVIATHADQALSLLTAPTPLESSLLSKWSYSKNSVCLHTDPVVMPPKKVAWSSWAVQQSISDKDSLNMTYYMNRLQRIKSQTPYFVTLNDNQTIKNSKKIHTVSFTHPIFNEKSVATQLELPKLNQSNKVLFCGSYFGNGFHEDGTRSAIEACKQLKVTL